MKKSWNARKKGSLLRLNNFIFLTIIRKIQNERTYPVVFMREAQTRQKSAGKKPNAQRQRLLASRKRKQRESALKAEAKIVWKRDAE